MTAVKRKPIFAVTAAALFGLMLLGYAYFIEPRRLVVNHHEIEVKNWNPVFDGLRIAVVADFHAGANGIDAAKLQQIVATTNEQNADIIVLLGDYVAQEQHRQDLRIQDRPLKMPVSEIADNLSGLRAKYGVFAVLGNHDGWFGQDAVIAELERAGYKVLNGEVAVIEKDGAKLRLIGLKDHMQMDGWKEFSDNAKSLLAATEGQGDVIALEHSPDMLPVITGQLSISNDLKLMLAGHTHGGQVWLPVIGAPIVPSSYGQKYAAGHVKDGGIDTFVTTGIGTSILPFRFLVPPEIAVLTIRSAQ